MESMVNFLRVDERVRAILKLSETFCVEKYEKMVSLGRFSLRNEGKIGFEKLLK